MDIIQGTDSDLHLPPVQALAPEGVLASSLPWNVGAAAAPTEYSVVVALNREARPLEADLVNAASTLMRLRAAGYDDIVIALAGRCLVVEGTNLAQLRNGLAGELARIFRDIPAAARAQQDTSAPGPVAPPQPEGERRQAVSALAAQVSFAC